jgi:hypothetical protein
MIATCEADEAAIAREMAKAGEAMQKAALALVAGLRRLSGCAKDLIPLLAEDGIAGRAAAWALARIGGAEVEQRVLAAIRDGKLDQRENGYWCLTTLAALGGASATLADALVACVEAEIAKVKAGGSSLADHACRVLAVLGDKRCDGLAQQAMDADRFCDRFELNRLRKAVADGGRDTDTIKERSASWSELFADHLASEAIPEPAAKPASPTKPGSTATVAEGPPSYDMGPPAYGAGDPAAGMDAAEGTEGEEAPPSKAKPVDWAAFAASPEAEALPKQSRQLAEQFGKVLEQFAMRAVGVPLADLAGQEFAALLLQVVPQAMQPQHVQLALSPQALNGYQALARFLHRTGASTNGTEMIDAVKLVRKQMQEQMRRAGIIGGPDYSDPDDKKTLV